MSATVNRLRQRAVNELKALQQAPRALSRRVYFVAGITDENGSSAWGDPDTTTDCLRLWVPRCLGNAASRVTWVSFCSDAAGKQPLEYQSFVEFGADLARRIHADIDGTQDEIDLVCHSMGGLDAAAAIALMDVYAHTYDVPPIRGVRNIITYDTPFRGSINAGSAFFNAIKRYQGRGQATIIAQGVAMEPGSESIGALQAQRDHFLRNVHAFWPRGAADHGGLLEVTHESAAFDYAVNFSPEWRTRYKDYVYYSATEHAGPTGVTRDPRAILDTLRILLGDTT